MRIRTEQRTLTKTRQRVEYTDHRGAVKGSTYLVIGPATDGTWMLKALGDPSWTDVDTMGECHNHFYDGHTRTVQEIELQAYKQHKVALSQLSLL